MLYFIAFFVFLRLPIRAEHDKVLKLLGDRNYSAHWV